MEKFHPILYSTPMVQAILEDRKTKTRRLRGLEEMNNCPDKWLPYAGDYFIDGNGRLNQKFYIPGGYSSHAVCPYGKVGDVLWVRETFQSILVGGENGMESAFIYKADDDCYKDTIEDWGGWKPSIFMPKSACRIFLKITDIKVERLQDISEDDAIKEGVLLHERGKHWLNYLDQKHGLTQFIYNCRSAKQSFQTLWELINGRESWYVNPFVWVISFKQINKPENFNS